MNDETKPRYTECYHGLQAKTCLKSGRLVHINGSPRKCEAFAEFELVIAKPKPPPRWQPSEPAATSIETPEHAYTVGLAPVLGNPKRVLKPRFERQKIKPRMN